MKKKLKLAKLVALLNALPNICAELGDTTYLIRFGVEDDGLENNLALMSDLGVTWEPWRPYPTPTYCTVTLTDLPATAHKLARVAYAFSAGKLPWNVEHGEGAAAAL